MHEPLRCKLKHPVEPDGSKWEAAVAFSDALYRWQNYIIYGPSSHPFDDLDERFNEFIEHPKDRKFQRHLDRRVDVSSDVYDKLFDDCNTEDYYSSWQVLLCADLADAGVNIRINLADAGIARAAEEALQQGRIPEGASCSFNLLPVHAMRGFAQHESALDAVVWFAEERWRILSMIYSRRMGAGGFV